MKLFSGQVPDQYLAWTARLAASGHQQATMRPLGDRPPLDVLDPALGG